MEITVKHHRQHTLAKVVKLVLSEGEGLPFYEPE
jgi:hypothetical protein